MESTTRGAPEPTFYFKVKLINHSKKNKLKVSHNTISALLVKCPLITQGEHHLTSSFSSLIQSLKANNSHRCLILKSPERKQLISAHLTGVRVVPSPPLARFATCPAARVSVCGCAVHWSLNGVSVAQDTTGLNRTRTPRPRGRALSRPAARVSSAGDVPGTRRQFRRRRVHLIRSPPPADAGRTSCSAN